MRKILPILMVLSVLSFQFIEASSYRKSSGKRTRAKNQNNVEAYQGHEDVCQESVDMCQEYVCEDQTCVCYCPYVKYCPEYFNKPRCEPFQVTQYKKCVCYDDQYYQVKKCRMVPEYYYETHCRKVPKCYWEPYTVECQRTVYDRYCRMVPEYYYKKVCCPSDNSCEGGSLDYEDKTYAPENPSLEPMLIEGGVQR